MIRIGTSGWTYPPWRGEFYPKGLVQRRELEYLSRQVGSVEVNGSFYGLQRPESYRRWFERTPDDFMFSVKGGRLITHVKRMRRVETELANFFASGVLALEHKLGPFLWQLPPWMTFDADRLTEFFAQLPRTTRAAAALAGHHDDQLRQVWVEQGPDRGLQHAVEVRHPSFDSAECVDLLRKHDIALVVADSAGKWPQLEHRTADFVYVRLHGGKELYASGYSDDDLDEWAKKIRTWHDKAHEDVYVYFDNTMKGKAPGDAISLAGKLGIDMTAPDTGDPQALLACSACSPSRSRG